MTITTTIFDPAEAMAGDPAVQQAFLAAAFESDDPAHITKALGIVARAKGMTEVATTAGITRQGLHKALGKNGDPRLTTLIGVLKALGYHLTATQAATTEVDHEEHELA